MEVLNKSVSSPNAHAFGPEEVRKIQEELELLLSRPPFRSTQQCQNLLRYIVRHSLAEEDQLLRERVIGAEVFGRRPDYETGEDPVVRMRVAEVRKRLAQYYVSLPEAPNLRIEIPSGSYRAVFRWQGTSEAAHRPALSPEEADIAVPEARVNGERQLVARPSPPEPSREVSSRRRRWIPQAVFAGIVCLAIFVAGAVFWLRGPNQSSAVQRFWQPWTNGAKPILISIGSNDVYRLKPETADRYAKEHNLRTHGLEFFVPVDNDPGLKTSDFTPADDSFVALGDVAAVSRVVSTLSRLKHPFQERFPNDISFAELREAPSVLIGGFNNPTAMELMKGLPIVLTARNEIDEEPSGRRWILNAPTDSHDTEDYAIVTRWAAKGGDAPVMSVAGIGQYGTIAAAEFVCDEGKLNHLVQTLPKGWESRNLQLLLHVKVLDFKATDPEIVAQRTW